MTTPKKSSFFRKESSERGLDNSQPQSEPAKESRAPRATPKSAPRTAPKPKADWVKKERPSGDKPYRKDSDAKPYRKSSDSKPYKKDFAAKPDRDRKESRTRTTARPTAPKEELTQRAPGVAARSAKTSKAPKITKAADGPVRLNKFIAQSGVCSRREADELIATGAITVNGKMVTELGTKVDPAVDTVEYDGKRLSGEKFVYIIMNKPKGYIASVEDPHNEDTVITLLKGQVKERVYPVGRLDKNTTGVLLLTNDGELTKVLTHPSYERRKIYHVFLDKPCTEEHLEQIAKGIELEDGEIHADEVSYVEGNRKEVGIEIHSGRNRIVRRIFEHLGYDVIKLDRVFFAGMTKMGLRRGFWRYLSPKEIMALKSDN